MWCGRHTEAAGNPLRFTLKTMVLLFYANAQREKQQFCQQGNSHAARILMQ